MAKKTGAEPGDVVRYVPAPEPIVAALAIALLTIVELIFAIGFIFLLVTSGESYEGAVVHVPGLGEYSFDGNSVYTQQTEAFLLGGALLTLAAILSLYRKFFLPDVMLVKRRKLKYEDLM